MCNFDAQQIEQLLGALRSWSAAEPRVKGMALVGSWATGRAHAEADVDVVCIVNEPEKFRADTGWMSAIDWPSAGLKAGRWSDCDYGRACSRHLTFEGGAEVELSFVAPEWAAVEPIDPGTRRVASDGMRVVHDPNGMLARLVEVL
ncbi:MAG: nucleotidyltransferase domain-containing protein [Proteobacteria bacterium]|nr:nucleotidyltransferase domain-containing protein [Pseudomonadota bacterium]